MVNVRVVQDALAELAAKLVVPADMLKIHRESNTRGPRREYQSLRFGIFLLTYPPFEYFFNEIVGGHNGPTRDLPVNPDKVREAFRQHLGVDNVTQHWAARVRVAPEPGASTGIAPWKVLRTNGLRDYLGDAQHLRNLLGHGANPANARNRARSLYTVKAGSSIRLPWVEGFLQCVQDIVTETALTVSPDVTIPDWPEVMRSGTSAPSLPSAPYDGLL